MKPTLIITMGVTGSGKSKLANKMIELLRLKDPKFFLIDEYVENDTMYKKDIKKFVKRKNSRSKLRKPSRKTLKYFEKSYFKSRNTGCKTKLKRKSIPKKKCIDLEKGGCNRLHDIELNNAILKEENIIIETTGGYYPKWIIEAINKCNKYNIVIAGIKVSLRKLIQRNTSRSIQAFDLFLKNMEKNPAPRLPDINQKVLKKHKINLDKTLKGIIMNGCVKGNKKNIEYCSKYFIDRLIIFDNNTDMKIIYDSN